MFFFCLFCFLTSTPFFSGGSSDEGDRLLLHSLPAVFGAQRGVCGAGRPLERRLPWRLLLGRQDHAVQLASRAHGGRPGGAVRKR